jgi:hypothetical protein
VVGLSFFVPLTPRRKISSTRAAAEKHERAVQFFKRRH